jgi:peptidoglycan/LPS O-acetylase OafA/YrhL
VKHVQKRPEGHDSFIYPLRILAFGSVFIGHYWIPEIVSLTGDKNENVSKIFASFAPLWRNGAFGVALFFLISGYVITKALNRENLRIFFFRRVFRIFPMYTVALVIFWITQVAFAEKPWPSVKLIIASLSLLGDFKGAPNQLGGVDWTLRVEILFYLFVGITTYLVSVVLRNKFGESRSLLLITFTLGITLTLVPAFPRGGFAGGYLNFFAPIFMTGMAFALNSLGQLGKGMTSIIAIYSYFLSTSKQSELRPDLNLGSYLLWSYLIFILFYSLRNRFASNSIIIWISGLTYTFYLFHNWMFSYIDKILRALVNKIALPDLTEFKFLGILSVQSIISLSLFIIIVDFFVRRIERPIINWSRSKSFS